MTCHWPASRTEATRHPAASPPYDSATTPSLRYDTKGLWLEIHQCAVRRRHRRHAAAGPVRRVYIELRDSPERVRQLVVATEEAANIGSAQCSMLRILDVQSNSVALNTLHEPCPTHARTLSVSWRESVLVLANETSKGFGTVQ